MHDLEEYVMITRRSEREEDGDDDGVGGGEESHERHVANVGAVRAKGLRHLTSALEGLTDFQLRYNDEGAADGRRRQQAVATNKGRWRDNG